MREAPKRYVDADIVPKVIAPIGDIPRARAIINRFEERVLPEILAQGVDPMNPREIPPREDPFTREVLSEVIELDVFRGLVANVPEFEGREVVIPHDDPQNSESEVILKLADDRDPSSRELRKTVPNNDGKPYEVVSYRVFNIGTGKSESVRVFDAADEVFVEFFGDRDSFSSVHVPPQGRVVTTSGEFSKNPDGSPLFQNVKLGVENLSYTPNGDPIV